MDYYYKYLKYKNKYLLLKNQYLLLKNQYGGGNITDLEGTKIIFNLIIDKETIILILKELGIKNCKIYRKNRKC